VAYISGRAESLAAFFMLVSFMSYIKSLEDSRRLYFFAVIFFYIGALLSKEYSVVLLLLILFYHYVFLMRLELKKFLPLCGVTLFYFICRQMVLGPFSCPHLPLIQRIPGFFVAVAQYVFLLFWPLDLHMGYEPQAFSWLDARALTGLLIILSGIILLRYRRRYPLLVFAVGWFIIALFPVSNIVIPLWTYMAEHWLYVPSIGFFLILAKGLTCLARRKDVRWVAFLLIGCLFIFYSFLTIRQNYYWRDPVTFYEKTLRYAPNHTAILINLGIEYNNRGEPAKATALFMKTLDILLQSSAVDNNLALTCVREGRFPDAIPFFKKAILYISYNDYLHDSFIKINDALLVRKVKEIDVIKARLYGNLAQAYLEIKDFQKALTCFKKAVAINPALRQEYQRR
jgi:tetratricopeptide (TPR) repeat protein